MVPRIQDAYTCVSLNSGLEGKKKEEEKKRKEKKKNLGRLIDVDGELDLAACEGRLVGLLVDLLSASNHSF